jgi:DNA-binding NtrC family response regulator
MEVLKLHDWPCNIGELENIIKRDVIVSTGPILRPLLGELKRPGQTSLAAKRTLAEAHLPRQIAAVSGMESSGVAGVIPPSSAIMFSHHVLRLATRTGNPICQDRE